MKALNTLNILDSIIPISRFNKGEANKIFSDVKKFGTKIVVKNTQHQDLMDKKKRRERFWLRSLPRSHRLIYLLG